MYDSQKADALKAELERILATPEMGRSPVLRRLLTYLAVETLAGRGKQLKAYHVAVDGLGRDNDFDPQSDSYPRVQVGRLRRLLDIVYAEHGASSAPGNPRLTIPLGSYAIEFAPVAQADGAAGIVEASTGDIGSQPSISPTPTIAGGSVVIRPWMLGLVTALLLLITALSVYAIMGGSTTVSDTMMATARDTGRPRIRITTQEANLPTDSPVRKAAYLFEFDLQRFESLLVSNALETRGPAKDNVQSYDLQLQSATIDGAPSVIAVLRHYGSKTTVWSSEIKADNEKLDAKIGQLVSTLATSGGVIATHQLTLHRDNYSAGYPCLLQFGELRRGAPTASRDRVQACLDKSVRLFPTDPQILSAQSYMAYSAQRPFTPAQRQASLAWAQKAIDFGRGSPDANLSMARSAMMLDRCPRVRVYGNRAIELNPLDPKNLSIVGALLIGCGDYQTSEDYLRQSVALDRDGLEYQWAGLILINVLKNQPEAALAIVRDAPVATSNLAPYTLLANTLAYAQNNMDEQAAQNWKRLVTGMGMPPGTPVDRVVDHLVVSPLLAKRVIAEMRQIEAVHKTAKPLMPS